MSMSSNAPSFDVIILFACTFCARLQYPECLEYWERVVSVIHNETSEEKKEKLGQEVNNFTVVYVFFRDFNPAFAI